MGDFDRGISNSAFLDALAESPIFKEIKTDPELFIGIREESVDVFYKMNCILTFEEEVNSFRGKIDYKYLLQPEREEDFVGMDPQGNLDIWKYGFVMENFDKDRLKKSAKRFATTEMAGVHHILHSPNNLHAIDTEIAFRESNAMKRQSCPKGENQKFDIAALLTDKEVPELAFYEAHEYLSRDIRGDSEEAPLSTQIGIYEDRIRRNEQKIKSSYIDVLLDRLSLGILPESLHKVAWKIVRKETDLVVRPSVSLAIFNFTQEQKNSHVWQACVQEGLVDKAGIHVIAAEDPRDIILD